MRRFIALVMLVALTGCYERAMEAPNPRAVTLAIKARCDADDAVRAAGNPTHAYLWRLESWHEQDDWIRFYIAKYDDIFTRTRMEIQVFPASDPGKVTVKYSYHAPNGTPLSDLALIPLELDRPSPQAILDTIQALVAAPAPQPEAKTVKEP